MAEYNYTPVSGDLCQILEGYMVRHYSCDQHADGTVTDVHTGEVVSQR